MKDGTMKEYLIKTLRLLRKIPKLLWPIVSNCILLWMIFSLKDYTHVSEGIILAQISFVQVGMLSWVLEIMSENYSFTYGKKIRTYILNMVKPFASGRVGFFSASYTQKALGICFILMLLGMFEPVNITVVTDPLGMDDLLIMSIFIGTAWELGHVAFDTFMVLPKRMGEDLYKIFFSDIEPEES